MGTCLDWSQAGDEDCAMLDSGLPRTGGCTASSQFPWAAWNLEGDRGQSRGHQVGSPWG